MSASETGQAQRGLYGSEIGTSVTRPATAELIGTFILVFAGIAVATAALLERATAGAPYDSLSVALAFGGTLAALVAALGHISGAHLNPAVTVALAATGKFPWRFVPAYVVAQLGGAILAALATWLVLGGAARDKALLAATYPAKAAGSGQAFIVEILITFILVFIIIAVATDERAEGPAVPFAVGLALAAGVFIGGPISGGAVNPARALGPMLVAGDLSSFWLYILGPLIGGVLAAVLYDRFLGHAEAPA